MSSFTFGPLAQTEFKSLFQPFSIRGHTLKNRFAVAPMTRARAGQSLLPNDLIRDYYVQFASSGLIITEGVHVSEQGRGWVDVPGLWTPDQTNKWKAVTQAVHDKGGVIFAQLWHQGRQSHSTFHPGQPIVSASEIPLTAQTHAADYTKKDPEVPHSLTKEEIKQVVQDFVTAAKNAIDAGFDGVELHGANGYLLDQFQQSISNKRTDEYGGSVENRFRFVGEVLDAVIAAIGKDRVGIRYSPNGAFGEMGSPDNREQFTYAIQETGKRNIAFVHLMDGLAFGFHNFGEPFTLKDARALLPRSVALIGNCGYTPESAEARLREGDADLIAFGRPYLNNPDLPIRVSHGYPQNEPLPHHLWNQPTEAYKTGEGYIIPAYQPPVASL